MEVFLNFLIFILKQTSVTDEERYILPKMVQLTLNMKNTNQYGGFIHMGICIPIVSLHTIWSALNVSFKLYQGLIILHGFKQIITGNYWKLLIKRQSEPNSILCYFCHCNVLKGGGMFSELSLYSTELLLAYHSSSFQYHTFTCTNHRCELTVLCYYENMVNDPYPFRG